MVLKTLHLTCKHQACHSSHLPQCSDWVLWLIASSRISYRVLPPGPGVVSSWCLDPLTLGFRKVVARGAEVGTYTLVLKALWGRQTMCSLSSTRQLPFSVHYWGVCYNKGSRGRRGFCPSSFFWWHSRWESWDENREIKSTVDNFQMHMYREHRANDARTRYWDLEKWSTNNGPEGQEGCWGGLRCTLSFCPAHLNLLPSLITSFCPLLISRLKRGYSSHLSLGLFGTELDCLRFLLADSNC